MTIHFIQTPESLPSDYPFMEGLGVSSRARAMLENLEPDRTQGDEEKCLPVEAIDSHDILGTYAIASNRGEMSRRADSEDGFLKLLRARHRVIMSGRPSSAPGLFKTRDNRAGNTHFVSFDRVCGTLNGDSGLTFRLLFVLLFWYYPP